MKKVSIQSLLEFSFLSHPLISPDGDLVAFAVQKASAEKNGYDSDLYLLRKDGTVAQATFFGNVGNYIWTGKNTLLFTSLTGCQEAGKTLLYT